jgi:hypothetical protein
MLTLANIEALRQGQRQSFAPLPRKLSSFGNLGMPGLTPVWFGHEEI